MKPVKTTLQSFLFFFIIVCLTTGCANIVPITGGPKDVKEPTLVKTIPKIGTTNFKEKKLLIEFDEEIEVENNPSNIIVSPAMKEALKLNVRNKQFLEVSIPEGLEANTTYSININNAIKDITEGNIAKNISYAFSTGAQLDSLTIRGKTIDIENKTILKNSLIGLYKKSDTLNISKQKPFYITYSNNEGLFTLNYIKENDYYLLALNDKNKNLLYDNQEKATSIENLTVNQNTKSNLVLELSGSDSISNKIMSKKINKNIQVLAFRNGIKTYSYKTQNSKHQLYITQNRRKAKELQVFVKADASDSVYYTLNTTDSLGNSRTDTLVVNYSKKKMKSDEGKIYLDTKDILPGNKTIVFYTNKPILNINTDSILINTKANNYTYTLNTNRDSLKINLTESIQDTTSIKFNKSSVVFYDDDSLSAQLYNITKADLSNYSSLEMTIKTDSKNYIIQLISEDYIILEEYKNITKLKYDYIKPGKYKVRAIIDTNNNGGWDCGNVLKHKASESIKYFNNDGINLKPNWEIKDLMFIF